MKKLIQITGSLGLLIGAGIFITSLATTTASTSDAQSKELPKAYAQSMKLGDPMPGNLFIELAKLINPTVVNISTATIPRGRGNRDPFFDMLERFYGMPGMEAPQMKPMQALGTGFIIREDGLIVTNNHVIAQADVVNVQLNENDKKMYEATIIGRDERSDIALIKIKSDKKLPYAVLGSSDSSEVGEWVAAFGNPYGYGHTMTKGIISAKVRDISELNKFPLIQTDASINPGNSGGPLVNTRGQVIGVNSAIDARAQGIGFAIPIDEVKKILPQLEKEGHLKKGYIGVMLGELDPRYAKMFKLEPGEGVVITNTEKGGPADKGGMKPYDVITEVNSKKIRTAQDMMDTIGDTEVGTTAQVNVIRDGKTLSLKIKVIERPELKQARRGNRDLNKPLDGQEAPYQIGFKVTQMTEELKKDWGITTTSDSHQKPVIVEVKGGSIAQFAGLRPGDIILDVNKKEVKSPKDVLDALKKGQNTIRISRGEAVVITMFETE